MANLGCLPSVLGPRLTSIGDDVASAVSVITNGDFWVTDVYEVRCVSNDVQNFDRVVKALREAGKVMAYSNLHTTVKSLIDSDHTINIRPLLPWRIWLWVDDKSKVVRNSPIGEFPYQEAIDLFAFSARHRTYVYDEWLDEPATKQAVLFVVADEYHGAHNATRLIDYGHGFEMEGIADGLPMPEP